MSAEQKTELIKVEMSAPVTTGANVASILGQYKKSFEIIAPQHFDINRMLRLALMVTQRDGKLLQCTGSSLLGAFMLSVQLGLDIGAKEAYLVPFKNRYRDASGNWRDRMEVQLIPDYRGLAKLVRNTGEVRNIKPFVVYKQDYFLYEEGAAPKLEHTPNMDHDFLDSDIVGAYTRATFSGLPPFVECHFMSRSALERIRRMSKMGDSGPWKDHYAEMCKKTVVRAHCKSLPQSIELVQALDVDARASMSRPQAIDVVQDPVTGNALAEVNPIEESDEEQQPTQPQQPKSGSPGVLDQLTEQHSAAKSNSKVGK